MADPASKPVLTIGHSPDPDDAFMWRPLTTPADEGGPAIDTGRFAYRAVPDDIESLNRRAVEQADLDITAISIHAYPHVKGRYALTACGASMGEGYGPKVVAREPRPESWLREKGVRIAIPGKRTTAALTLRLLIGRDFEAVEVPFERVMDAVLAGDADAGVVIHEGQLTYPDAGLSLVVDLGAWWTGRTGLPLPLGGNAVKRDLDERFGPGSLADVAQTLRRSVEHALANREAGVAHAAGFGRGISLQRTDEFVAMYVTPLSVDAGEKGRRAIERLLGDAAEAGLCPAPGAIDFV